MDRTALLDSEVTRAVSGLSKLQMTAGSMRTLRHFFQRPALSCHTLPGCFTVTADIFQLSHSIRMVSSCLRKNLRVTPACRHAALLGVRIRPVPDLSEGLVAASPAAGGAATWPCGWCGSWCRSECAESWSSVSAALHPLWHK